MTTSWRALTLRQPWAWAVCYAGKDVENRTWPVPATVELPLRVMIHAGLGWDGDARWAQPFDAFRDEGARAEFHRLFGCDYDQVPNAQVITSETDDDWCQVVPHPDHRGAVVAVATITGCRPDASVDEGECVDQTVRPVRTICSPWAQTGVDMWHWELADVTVLDEPVPATGKQRLWIPDDELIEQVEARV